MSRRWLAVVWSYRTLDFVFSGGPASNDTLQAHTLWLETAEGKRT